jgi:hypothetical protein
VDHEGTGVYNGTGRLEVAIAIQVHADEKNCDGVLASISVNVWVDGKHK